MRGERKIGDLISDIEARRLILPEFQRGYVWKPQKVRAYITSLYRGYPTGTFLIWSTPDPGKVRGGLSDSDADSKLFHLILDGQQRLTSIYTVVKGEPPSFYEEKQLFFNLYFDLRDETFAYYKPMVMKGNPEWIPVTTFFQEGLATFIQGRGEDDRVKKLYFDNLGKFQRLEAITNYAYFTDAIREPEIDRVVEIFNLVNSSGTSLSKSDFGLAHICASWPEARQTFRDARESLEAHHFSFGLDIITRMVSTVATGSALYEPLYNTPIEDVREAFSRVEPALSYLVNILRADAYIDSSDRLSSPYPLIPLVVRLSRSGGTFTTLGEKHGFLHWMYAALMWGRYSATSETKLNADIAVLSEPDAAERLRDNLIKERGRIEVQARDLQRAGVRSTFYPMSYVVARARGAVDWFNGQPLYSKAAGVAFGLETHHIFPTSVLYKSGAYASDNPTHRLVVNEIANLAFLTKHANIKISNKEPLAYLHDVAARFPGALEAQFVPMDESLWAVDQYEDFLAARRTLIAAAINEFMDALIADADEDVPVTLESLIAQGETPRIEYKASLRWDIKVKNVNKALTKAVTKTLAAFMNSQGGTLLIGVLDHGEVIGIQHDLDTLKPKDNTDGFELTLRNAVGKQLGEDVNPAVEVTFGDVSGRTVALVSCEPQPKPVFLEDGETREFYVRAGNSSRPLDVKEAAEYIAAHWNAAVAAAP